jgi:hypothetical protein
MKLKIYIYGVIVLALLASFNILNANAATGLYSAGPPKDTDFDGLTDQGEVQIYHTDPNNPDTDADGFLDGAEVLVGTDFLDKNDPPTEVIKPQQKTIPWMWYLTRASGITGYLLLFLLLVTGTGITSGYLFTLFGPIIAWRIHRTIGITLIAFVVTHLITLILDDFMKFSLAELLIPFYSAFKPLYMSLGIIGFYLFILIILTSIFFIVSKYKAWRLLHYLTFPTFVALFIHGVYTGTDTSTLAMQIVYWSTGIIVVIISIYRIIKIPSRRSRPRITDQQKGA